MQQKIMVQQGIVWDEEHKNRIRRILGKINSTMHTEKKDGKCLRLCREQLIEAIDLLFPAGFNYTANVGPNMTLDELPMTEREVSLAND